MPNKSNSGALTALSRAKISSISLAVSASMSRGIFLFFSLEIAVDAVVVWGSSAGVQLDRARLIIIKKGRKEDHIKEGMKMDKKLFFLESININFYGENEGFVGHYYVSIVLF